MKAVIDNLSPRRDSESAVIDAHGEAWSNCFDEDGAIPPFAFEKSWTIDLPY